MNFLKVRLTFVFFILMTFPAISLCQSSNLGNWWIYIGNKKLDNQWNWHHEVQYRNYNFIGDLEQLLLRTGIGHNLTEGNNNLLLGYGFIRSENYLSNGTTKAGLSEHRIYQQFITKQNIGAIAIQHRYRFEQRILKDDFRLRFRYFLAATIPLQPQQDQGGFYLSGYNEIFLNTEQTIFDRNRLYGGIGYQFSKAIKVEIGYMNQFLNNRSRDQINIFTFLNL